MTSIDCLRTLYSYFHFREYCPAYAYLSLGLVLVNACWAAVAFYGYQSIRLWDTRNIKTFSYLQLGNLFLRVLFYVVCGLVMRGYVNQVSFTPEEMESMLCKALYPESLFVAQGCLEVLLNSYIFVQTRSIREYMKEVICAAQH